MNPNYNSNYFFYTQEQAAADAKWNAKQHEESQTKLKEEIKLFIIEKQKEIVEELKTIIKDEIKNVLNPSPTQKQPRYFRFFDDREVYKIKDIDNSDTDIMKDIAFSLSSIGMKTYNPHISLHYIIDKYIEDKEGLLVTDAIVGYILQHIGVISLSGDIIFFVSNNKRFQLIEIVRV